MQTISIVKIGYIAVDDFDTLLYELDNHHIDFDENVSYDGGQEIKFDLEIDFSLPSSAVKAERFLKIFFSDDIVGEIIREKIKHFVVYQS